MQFLVDIIGALPAPWNIIVVISLLILVFLVVGILFVFIRKALQQGLQVGNVAIGGDSPSVTLSEDNVDKVFRVFIEALSTTLEQSKNKRLADKMDFVEGKLGLIHSLYKKEFFKLLESKDVEQRIVTQHDDYMMFDLSLRTALYLQNGVDCYKTIIRGELREQIYRSKDGVEYDEFIKNVGERLNTIYTKTFETYYKNSTFYGVGTDAVFRAVSAEEIYKIYDNTWNNVRNEIKAIFDNAKSIDTKYDTLEEDKMENSITTVKAVLRGE